MLPVNEYGVNQEEKERRGKTWEISPSGHETGCHASPDSHEMDGEILSLSENRRTSWAEQFLPKIDMNSPGRSLRQEPGRAAIRPTSAVRYYT